MVGVKVQHADGRQAEASKTIVVLTQAENFLSGIKAFPNPYTAVDAAFMPMIFGWNAGGTQGTIKIRIYNIKGEKVRELDEKLGTGFAAWDGKQDDGARVASGVYIVLFDALSDSGYLNKKRIKIAVLF